MREILFRGKRTDNGTWTYGYLFCIWERAYLCWGTTNNVPNMEEVLPETVCQFTGLYDRNGRKIFEGDIVKYSTNKVGIINYGIACFSVQDIKSRNNPALDIIFADYSNVEIIGNIYDNPELLKGGNDNG